MKIEKDIYIRFYEDACAEYDIDKIVKIDHNASFEYCVTRTLVYFEKNVPLYLDELNELIKQRNAKSSYNIIDLIEVGDILHCKHDDEYWTVQEHQGNMKWLQTEWKIVETNEEFLKTYDEIITKEQAKSLSYKVN